MSTTTNNRRPDVVSGNGSAVADLQPAFELRNLHRFFGKLKAVNNVSFKAYPGQVMGFIGPNGAGKTTAMRILATLDLPTAGDAFVDGLSVVDDADKVRRILGFMPDSFGRYPNVNVIEYLDFYARAYGFRGAKRRDAVDRVLTFTEMHKLAEKPIDTLSKGLSQRLGLGRTLIHDPRMLILDEPAAGLDPRARVELRELIHLLATDLKKTILISSHILTELSEICDSAAIIEAGKILACGTVSEILETLKHRRGRSAAILTLRVLRNAEALERLLLQQPFVSTVGLAGDSASFYFDGDDAQRARLLKHLVDQGVEIIEFSGKTENLEDAFMAITEGIMQ
ncbi:MAG TPA: ABC transporter ATP-binding protein [Planctomycetaceae bacterium]|nr:ABC transporter ATP-binding protein [Planctomycetaceae bacterium]